MEGGFLQLVQFSPRRCCKGSVVSEEGALWIQFESQCAHTGFIVYTEEEITLQKISRTTVPLPCLYSLPSLHEEASPVVRTTIGK